MTSKLRKPLLANLTWVTALVLTVAPVLYVLSYAPYVRLRGEFAISYTTSGSEIARWGDGRDYPVYEPVDWLIDHTPLQQPLFQWADLIGVKAEMEIAHLYRLLDPPPVSP